MWWNFLLIAVQNKVAIIPLCGRSISALNVVIGCVCIRGMEKLFSISGHILKVEVYDSTLNSD